MEQETKALEEAQEGAVPKPLTPEEALRIIINTPHKKADEWKYMKRKKRSRTRLLGLSSNHA